MIVRGAIDHHFAAEACPTCDARLHLVGYTEMVDPGDLDRVARRQRVDSYRCANGHEHHAFVTLFGDDRPSLTRGLFVGPCSEGVQVHVA